MKTTPVLEVENLQKLYYSSGGLFSGKRKPVKAVDGVSFSIARGEVLGLVGESGSGKSTVGRTLLRLHEPTAGTIRFDGEDITHASGQRMRDLRREMQIIFQDPFSSLNPRSRIMEIVGEAVDLRGALPKDEREASVIRLLEQVGLSRDHLHRFPHEFSGGQRQRLNIARALAVRPRFVVADEPVAALDVSIQAQVMNLLVDLQRDTGIALLFISHDLGLVEFIADKVMVMYLGRIVEMASARDLYSRPFHPYTRALLSTTPSVDPREARARKRTLLQGEPPSPANPPSGCTFRTRCPFAIAACAAERPAYRQVGEGHYHSCIRDDISGGEPLRAVA
ncbi:ABC transporter ATP-binding protein [Pseudochelatococcus lubricantis]|uniref:ABC transporter ATP-binding protein n=1 Tax=Pseudochelatococcus lubricantis TaxID=1538102 RepID=UPI00141E890E